MKFFRMILIAGEVLLVILLLLGIVFKVAECEKKDKSLSNIKEQHIKLDDEQQEKLLEESLLFGLWDLVMPVQQLLYLLQLI